MKIAIKFNELGNYISHCTNTNVTDLKQVVPNNEGFEFYEITQEQRKEIHYLKIVNGEITIDEQARQADLINADKAKQISIKRNRLNSLSQDLVQALAGETVPNLTERKQEFLQLHNEIRLYEGKTLRETNDSLSK